MKISCENSWADAMPSSAWARASSTRPRSASTSALMRPTQTPVGREPLLAEFVGCVSVVERLPPVAGEPLDLAQRPEDQSARPLVASCQRLPLQLLGHHARSLDLAQTGHQSGE